MLINSLTVELHFFIDLPLELEKKVLWKKTEQALNLTSSGPINIVIFFFYSLHAHV